MRRKVVSILVELLNSLPDGPRVADICTLLVGRVNDKDESIKVRILTLNLIALNMHLLLN